MSFDAGTITSELTLDRSPFIRSLRAARGEAAMFARAVYEAALGADDLRFTRSLEGAQRRGEGFSRQRFEALVGADTSPARRALTGFDETWRRYSRSWGQQGIRARVTTDLARTYANLRNLERALRDVTDPEHRVRLEAEVTRARQRLEGLRSLAASVGASDPTMTVGFRGYAATMAQMLGLQGVADRLDGYNVRFRADIDRSLSTALPNILGDLTQQVMRFRTVGVALASMTMPLMLTKIAAIPGVAAIAGTAAGSLGVTLGQGVAGGAGAATVALGLGAAALGVYGTALRQARDYAFRLNDIISQQTGDLNSAGGAVEAAEKELKRYTKGTREHELATRALALAKQNQRQEQEELNALLQSATPRVMRLSDAGHGLTLEMIALKGAIANEVAPTMTRWIGGATRLLPRVRPHLLDMISDMTRVGDSYVEAASKGQNLRSIETIVGGIKRAGVPALRLVANTAQLAVNMLAPMVPTGLDVLDILARLTGQANRWSQTAEGQRGIASAWGEMWDRGRRLVPVALDLGAGLWGIIRALDQSGVGDWLFEEIERGADSFERLMRAGGRGREEIAQFGRDSKPVLKAVMSLAGEGQRQFWRLVDAVRGSRKEGEKFGTLVDVIDSVRESLDPLVDLLIYEYKEIGPLIADIIPDLAEWFGLFAKSTPEFKIFLGLLNDGLELFNSLPESQRTAIARTIAYVGAFKALGGGAAISAFATLAGTVAQWALMRRLWQNFPKQPPMAAPGPAPVAGSAPKPGAPTPVPTAPDLSKSTRSLWAARLLTLASAAGLITIAVTYDYSGARSKMREVISVARRDGKLTGDEYTDAMADGVVEGLKGVPLIGSTMNWFYRNVIKPGDQQLGKWDPIDYWAQTKLLGKPPPKGLGGFGRGMMQGVINGMKAVPVVGVAMQLLETMHIRARAKAKASNWAKIGADAGNAIVSGWKRGGLVGAASSLVGLWFGRTQGSSRGKRWGGIGSSAASAIARGLPGGGLIVGAARLVDSWFGRTRGSSASKKWRGIGGGAAGDIASGWKSGGLVGAGIALVGQFFGRSSSSSRGKPWRGVGGNAAGAIISGWRSGGLVGAGAALIASFFERSSSSSRSKPWRGVGDGAASAIIAGWRNGGLIGAGISLVGEFFVKSSSSSRGRPWRDVGSSAVGAVMSGWKSGGLVGAGISLVSEFFARTQDGSRSRDWRGIGSSAIWGVIGGWNAVDVAGHFIRKIEGGYKALMKWLRPGSPSRRFRDMAKRLMGGGVVWGMDAAGPDIEAAAERMARRASRALGGLSQNVPLSVSPALRLTRTAVARSPSPSAHYADNRVFGGPRINLNVGADVEAQRRLVHQEIDRFFDQLNRRAGDTAPSFEGVV